MCEDEREKRLTLPPILPVSVTGHPEKPCLFLSMSSSRSVALGETQNGSRMNPFSKRFTLRTSTHCSSIVFEKKHTHTR